MSSEAKTVVFRARHGWRFGIVRMEVDKVSDKSVWLKGRRVSRESEGVKIVDSFEEAKSWLMGVAQRKLKAAERHAAEARADMERADTIRECDIETTTDRW